MAIVSTVYSLEFQLSQNEYEGCAQEGRSLRRDVNGRSHMEGELPRESPSKQDREGSESKQF